MTAASVGFHCPECAHAGRAEVHTARTVFASRRPVVTMSLIGLNALMFVASVATARQAGNLMFGMSWGSVKEWGLLTGFGIFPDGSPGGVATGEWWRIVTGGFLHAGLLHLGMNMLLLWLLGSQLAPVIGRVRFLALYVTSLLAGSFGVLLIDPTAATVGASGAVFGLMGAMVIALRSRGIDPWQSGIGGLIVLNLIITFTIPGISIGGHVGGLVGGLAAGSLVFALEKRVRSAWPAVAICAAMSAALWVGCLWAAEQWRDPVLGFLPF
jgi:membrane associated rhomboid family serine protease